MMPKTFFGEDFFMLLLYHILNLRSIYFIEENVLCRGVFKNNGKRPLPCSRIGKRALFFNPRLSHSGILVLHLLNLHGIRLLHVIPALGGHLFIELVLHLQAAV